ncbi:MAG TPA: MMPL family transporter [Candidatus Binataceae bacterium]|nr:MMPL family transporter [Candidatus Binataceae bacterium]
MTRFNQLVVQWPRLIVLLALLITAFLGYHARHVRFDSSVDNLYDRNDPEKKYYEAVRARFGSEDMDVIGLVADNVYTPATLAKIKRITAEVEQLDGVGRVQSLTNVPDPIADLGNPPRLIPQIPTDPAALDALRRKVASTPIYLNVVSRDGKGAAILIFFKDEIGNDEAAQSRLDGRLEEIIAHERGPERLYLTGSEHITVNSLRLMRRDLRTFTPLSLAVIIVILGLCFRNLRGVLLPVMSVVCGVVWTLGIMVLTGAAITIGTLVLPTLLIVIGSTYSIYVIAQYEDEVYKGGSAEQIALRTLARVTVPVTVAAFTTVVGFATLLVSRIATIQALGLYAAIGFVCLTTVMLTLMPAILVLLPLRRHTIALRESNRLSAWLVRVGNFDRQYRVPIMIAAGLLVFPCLWGIARIRADLNFIEYFRKSSPVRQANEIIGEKIGGTQNFDVIVESGKKGGAMTFELFQRIKGLQNYLAVMPGVDQTLSIVDYGELLDRAIQNNAAGAGTAGGAIGNPSTGFWQHPERFPGIAQLVYLNQQQGSASAFAAVLSPDSTVARILVRTRLNSSSDIMQVARAIRRYGKEHFPPEVSVRPTGSLILLNGATDDIVRGQIISLAFAIAVIFVVLWLLFLSIKVGFLSLLPNVLAILLLFGVMGITGIPLNVGTSVIASIAIGIAVEDAIRYLARLSDETRATDDQDKAIARTIATVGKPIIYASTALGLGFMVFLFSNFVPIQTFGFLTALTVLTALVNDLVLLPALLATTRIITLWDLLYLKLGKDPHKTIGLFDGLRASQAKIVALMGELKTFPLGQAIVRQGEAGDAMFVLIGGRAEVRVNANGQSRVVRQVNRGDVFGEMGLLRHQERTADIVATEDVEVLVVNERFLGRMQKRYPRIGAKIFLNIAKTLSDRLEQESIRT